MEWHRVGNVFQESEKTGQWKWPYISNVDQLATPRFLLDNGENKGVNATLTFFFIIFYVYGQSVASISSNYKAKATSSVVDQQI